MRSRHVSRHGKGVYKVPSPAAVQVNPFKVECTIHGVRVYGGVFHTASQARACRKGMEAMKQALIASGLIPPVNTGGRPRKHPV